MNHIQSKCYHDNNLIQLDFIDEHHYINFIFFKGT